MVHAAVSACAPSHLVLLLHGDGGPAGYKLRGRIEIEGLDAWRLDALENALARELGGRATFTLGPPDLENLLHGEQVEETVRRLRREYALTEAEFAAKSGLSLDQVRDLCRTTRRRHGKTVRRVLALAMRLAMRPTLGELLRRQRAGAGRQSTPRLRAAVAEEIGVSESVYAAWEDDAMPVPPTFLRPITRVLGLHPEALRSYMPDLPEARSAGDVLDTLSIPYGYGMDTLPIPPRARTLTRPVQDKKRTAVRTARAREGSPGSSRHLARPERHGCFSQRERRTDNGWKSTATATTTAALGCPDAPQRPIRWAVWGIRVNNMPLCSVGPLVPLLREARRAGA